MSGATGGDATRVVISGTGCVSAAGVGVSALWDAARSGRSGVGPLSYARGTPNLVRIAAQARDFDAQRDAGVDPGSVDRVTALALAAAREAVIASGLEPAALAEGTAVILGTGIGGASSFDDGCHTLYTTTARIAPLTIPRAMPSACASHVSMAFGIHGPTFVVSSACASAAQAIGLGLQLIRAGVVERALVGGSEALITPAVMRGWEAMRVLAPDACRPFSTGRNGMTIGEGAAVLVLERRDAARARGADVSLELAGYGTSSDARDLLRPDPEGAAGALRLALADAGVDAAAIGHVNAHGTGTVVNDVAETRAIRLAFGTHADRIPVTSTKPVHGHALGAGGAIECLVLAQALRAGLAPPTLNWLGADPDCDLDVVRGAPRPLASEYGVSNSFAFGGINAVLVLRRAG